MIKYGTKKQLIRLYNSFVTGYFSHGLDTQPLLPPKWYSRLQKIVCNFLKIITNQTYNKTGINVSHHQLLFPYHLKNLYFLHEYLLMNRLNSIFMDSKPSELYDLLKPCMIRDNGELALQPFSGENLVKSETRNKFQFL